MRVMSWAFPILWPRDPLTLVSRPVGFPRRTYRRRTDNCVCLVRHFLGRLGNGIDGWSRGALWGSRLISVAPAILTPNKLRILVARSRDKIRGWTKSGQGRGTWTFNEEGWLRRRPGPGGSVVAGRRGSPAGLPRGRERGPVAAQTGGDSLPGQTAPLTRGGPRAGEPAPEGRDAVMATAAGTGAGSARGAGSRCDTGDTGAAARRPEGATGDWQPVRQWRPGPRRRAACAPAQVGRGR